MNEPAPAGKGLAERSAVPARVRAFTAAIAEVFETHQQTLDLSEHSARRTFNRRSAFAPISGR